MSSSSQQHCRSGKYRDLMNFTKVHHDHLSFSKRKTDTHNLKISVRPELATKISSREFSDVRQNMQGLNHNSVTINAQVRKGGLHSILFDNVNNKADNQILGVILDACNHFVHRKTKNRRYITFSSGLNGLKANVPVINENCETGVYDGNFSGFRFKKKYNFCLVALLAVAMCFFVSCGGGSDKPVNGGDESVSNFGKLGQECYPNETCDKGLICDTENNICVEDPDNPVSGSDDPTDTDKPDEQNNQNDHDTPVEQPDEDHQETPNDQDIPVEQPDEDIPENPNDQDVPENPDEQPDQDVPNPQDNQGKCDPGYVWVDYSIDTWVAKNYPDKDYDNQCVACVDLTSILDKLRGLNRYCPGGDDLKGKRILGDQTEQCPEYTFVNDSLSDCICTYGVPPPGEECQPTTRKKPLIIKPKVNN